MSEYIDEYLNSSSERMGSAKYGYPIPVTKKILKANKLLAFDKKTPPEKLSTQGPFRVDESPVSHNEAMNSLHAIDFLMPVGTPVLAVKNGKVGLIKEDSAEYWRWPEFGDKANYVNIIHDDGTMSQYIHLAQNSVSDSGLTFWNDVKKWQKIWEVWLSGWLDIPHLHFALYQRVAGGELKNIQIKFQKRIMNTLLSLGI